MITPRQYLYDEVLVPAESGIEREVDLRIVKFRGKGYVQIFRDSFNDTMRETLNRYKTAGWTLKFPYPDTAELIPWGRTALITIVRE